MNTEASGTGNFCYCVRQKIGSWGAISYRPLGVWSSHVERKTCKKQAPPFFVICARCLGSSFCLLGVSSVRSSWWVMGSQSHVTSENILFCISPVRCYSLGLFAIKTLTPHILRTEPSVRFSTVTKILRHLAADRGKSLLAHPLLVDEVPLGD